MKATFLIPSSGVNWRLYYLVPISFVYFYSEFGKSLYLLLAVLALLGAVSRHTLEEAIYGPNGQDKADLSMEEIHKRIATVYYRDKIPSQYSGESAKEIHSEAELSSLGHSLIAAILSIFQLAFSTLAALAIFIFVTNVSEIDFFGLLILFSLSALIFYGLFSEIWPNVSKLDAHVEDIDPKMKENYEGFVNTLYGEDIFVSTGEYTLTDAMFTVNLTVDYNIKGQVIDDVHRTAVAFCSIVDRSTYPIERGQFKISTAEGSDVRFSIDPKWAREFSENEINSEDYFRRIYRTVYIDSPNDLQFREILQEKES